MLDNTMIPLAEEVGRDKHRQKGETFTDAMFRIATALADDYLHREAFLDIIHDRRFLPAGRVQAAAGSFRTVTAFNCFVSGEIPDSMDGIMDRLKEAALTMKKGGGIGYDFSSLRPRGDLIKSLDSSSSGPISFMEPFDAVCGTVSSAGNRRGAQMAVLRIDHPDILQFIRAKTNETAFLRFNVSVGVTDEFMEAVVADTTFNLRFGGQIYQTVMAREIWNELMQATWDWAEPGVLFLDRINGMNNLWYCETIAATNPCVPADTPILTNRGYVEIGDVIGEEVEVWNGKEFSKVTPRKTGENQPMVKVLLSDGSELRCTTAHRFVLANGYRLPAEELEAGMQLVKSQWPVVEGQTSIKLDFYAQGFYSGDGWQKENGGQYIGLYGRKRDIPHNWGALSRRTYEITGGYPGTDLDAEKEYLYFPKGTFQPKGYVPDHGVSLADRRSWLAGLVDSDGFVTNDSCIQISSKDRGFLYRVKLMVNTMGSNGTLSQMKDCWRLSISGTCAHILRLPMHRFSIAPVGASKERFPTVVSVEPDGVEAHVYCFTEEKAHMGVFNGMLTGQCGEQPLPPYGACLLGSLNLARYVKFNTWGGVFDMAQLKADIPYIVRAMDNVIDRTIYPLPQQAEEAVNKRRMGIGVTGLANALEGLGFRYGTEDALWVTETLMKVVANECYRASIALAKEKGAFPLFDRDKYLQGAFIKQLDEDVWEGIARYGIRNSHLTSVAPAGSISIAAGNVSNGLEPPFALEYDRTVKGFDEDKVERVTDYAYRVWGIEGVTAAQLTPKQHVEMLTTVQKWVDSAVSKTCNIGNDVTFEEFKNVYMQAWVGGAKGCTTYRAAGKRYGVLNEVTEGAACFIDPETGKKTCD